MFLLYVRVHTHFYSHFQCLLLVLILTAASFATGYAQGIETMGTGGSNTIQGRIYFPSGVRADVSIRVRLESTNSGPLTVNSDLNGSFSFRNLEPGNYTVTVEGGDDYETMRESVYIDRDRRGTKGRSSFTIPIYLQPKRKGKETVKPGVLNAALANVPKSAAELYAKAIESIGAGETQKAIEQLRAAIALSPGFALALNELGVQYLKLGQSDKAAPVLQSAVKFAPDDFTPRLNYGVALLEERKFTEAEMQLRHALKKNEASPTAHMYLGLALINLRNYDEALKELERAVNLGGKEIAPLHYYLGGLYWRNKEYKRAADELELYLKLVPKSPEAERIRATIKELRSKS